MPRAEAPAPASSGRRKNQVFAHELKLRDSGSAWGLRAFRLKSWRSMVKLLLTVAAFEICKPETGLCSGDKDRQPLSGQRPAHTLCPVILAGLFLWGAPPTWGGHQPSPLVRGLSSPPPGVLFLRPGTPAHVGSQTHARPAVTLFWAIRYLHPSSCR